MALSSGKLTFDMNRAYSLKLKPAIRTAIRLLSSENRDVKLNDVILLTLPTIYSPAKKSSVLIAFYMFLGITD